MSPLQIARRLLLRSLLLAVCAAGFALLLFVLTAAASATPLASVSGQPIWGTDIRVGSGSLGLMALGPLFPGGNARPSAPPWEQERDISLAISPADENFVVGGYEAINYDDDHARFAASTDGGYSWQGGSFNGTYFGDLQTLFDPLVAFDRQGTAYYAVQATGGSDSGYLVFTSTDGLNWSQPLPAAVAPYTEFRDHADLAIDHQVPGSEPYVGSIYLAYLYNRVTKPYATGLIKLRYSRDGGNSWSRDVQISDDPIQYGDGPSLAIASDGTLYAAYAFLEDNHYSGTRKLYLDRSTDGGQTWGTDHLVTGAPIVPIGAVDFDNHELALAESNDPLGGCHIVRINNYPTIGVSPTNSNEVYVVWNDGRWDVQTDLCDRPDPHHSDIAFTRTTDGGATWSQIVRINDDPQGDGIDQWQPTMRVEADGTIAVTWYDRRYTSNTALYDLAYSQSTDGGLTWTPNVRISDQSSDSTQLGGAKGVDDLAFRKGMAVGTNYILPGWIDTRDATLYGHVYVDHGVFSSATPTSTSTAISSPSSMPTLSPTDTASFTVTAGPTSSVTRTATRTATRSATSTPTSALTALPTSTATACTLSFSDVPPGSTFYAYIRCLACMGIINGYPDGTFKPNNNVTRGQLAKIVANAAGFSENVSGQMFQDLPPGSTFYVYAGRLAMHGAISGYPCGGAEEPCVAPSYLPYFRPNNGSTRGQISKIVALAAGLHDPPGGQIFEDVPPGSTFYAYIQLLASREIMSGYPCGGAGEPCVAPGNRPYFRQNNNATRGQTSKIVSNTFLP